MKKVVAEPYRDIDFARAKTKISIRLDNAVIDHFRSVVDESDGGKLSKLINDALLAYIQQRSVLNAVRQSSGRSLHCGIWGVLQLGARPAAAPT